MRARFQHHLRRAEHRLRRQRRRHVARQAHAHAAVAQRLDHHVDERRPAAAQAGHGVEQVFRQAERPADGVEQPLDQGHVVGAWPLGPAA